MDPGSSTGYLISLFIILVLSIITRMLRTAVMTSDSTKLDERLQAQINNRENVISKLQLNYELLKIIFVMVFTALVIRTLDKYDFDRAIDISVFICSTIVAMFIYDLITIEFADRYGAYKPNQTLRGLQVFLTIKMLIIEPIYKLQVTLRNFFAKLIGLPKVTSKVTIDQIKVLVEIGEKQGIINTAEKEMIEGVMEFNETVAEEIMTPRTEVFMIDINSEPEEYLEDLVNHRYSRVPVYDDDIDDIVGVLYLSLIHI